MELIPEGTMMLYSILYTFVAAYVFIAARKCNRILKIWHELRTNTITYFKNYDRRGNPKLSDLNLDGSRFGFYKFVVYTIQVLSGVIAIASLYQFVDCGFIHSGANVLYGWDVVIVLTLLTSAIVIESIKTGAHCDITSIQHDLSIVIDRKSSQK